MVMPPMIQTQLCQKLSENGCSSEEQLKVSHSFKLDNDYLLIFFYLNKPNAMYHHGYVNIPVIVDIEGKWRIINTHMDAEIQEIGRDPQGGIWVQTLWMIEGVSPTLYYSKNGVEWRRISFPLKRRINSAFEDVQVCFLEKEILLTFKSLGGDKVVKAWKTTYADAITKEPQWKRIPREDICQQSCSQTSAYNNAWQNRGKQANLDLFFQHRYKPLTLSVPSFTATHRVSPMQKNVISKVSQPIEKSYAIQLGTFNYKPNLDNMQKNMQNMLGNIQHTFQTKELKTNKGIKHKLYLGSFKQRALAQETLKALRNKHKNSKILKNAFVATLP